MSGIMNDEEQMLHDAFLTYDNGEKGYLTRIELQKTIGDVLFQDLSMDHIETLYTEFDKNEDGKIDFPEFKEMHRYIKEAKRKKRGSAKSFGIEDMNHFASFSASYATYETDMDSTNASMAMTKVLEKAVKQRRRDCNCMLRNIAKDIYAIRNILCIQDNNIEKLAGKEKDEDSALTMHASSAINFHDLFEEDDTEWTNSIGEIEEFNPMDPDFEAAFPASDMRCLALVSHNGMKKTMREFVEANRNLLKKFRLTGTNSTMTMLKEVFKDEPPGTIVFGPACASGPLGGDAELVAHMVGGKIGGVIFFQDPMNAHPHRADIDCLVRQALVHNVVMAETPTSALMICQTLRMALIGKGRPELIPSFFFSLQSPTVEAYKAGQKAVVDAQKAMVNAGK